MGGNPQTQTSHQEKTTMTTVKEFVQMVAMGNTEMDQLEQIARELLPTLTAPAKPAETPDYSPADLAFIQAARNEWANDECEIDANPVVSPGDDGAFVA